MYDYLAKIILLGPSGCGKSVVLTPLTSVWASTNITVFTNSICALGLVYYIGLSVANVCNLRFFLIDYSTRHLGR